MSKEVVIIDYGAGNIQSIQFALDRLGCPSVLSSDKAWIENAEKVIFPGVGHAESAMKKLKETGLHDLIPKLKQPVLGICLGMQLMCKSTEEGPTEGLGVFDVDVKHFRIDQKVPHMGWNLIRNLKSGLFKDLPEQTYMYFVHSYFVPANTESIADSDYGLNFCAALQKNNFYGVQFHPEKSGVWGEQILKNFLKL
jgi:glutamine amidotransferase